MYMYDHFPWQYYRITFLLFTCREKWVTRVLQVYQDLMEFR